MEIDLTDTKAVHSESPSTAVRENNSVEVDVLQHKLEELTMVKKRAETAEEKAQSFKELLDDSNNRLKKLHMDMESERSSMRQKSEELRQETLEMKKSMYELQEQIKSLQRVKSSLEQKTTFHNTEVAGLKEQLKISQEKLLKRSSMEQENSHRMHSLEEELSSKQAEIDQLKFKYDELTKINVLLDSDIRGIQMNTESLQQDKSFCEQKIKSLKSERESWKQQLQKAKEENTLKKRSEQERQLKCKNLEVELQKSSLSASQLQRQVEELKKINLEMEKNIKNVRAQLDQVTMEIGSKDQQIKIFKSQVEGTKSQVRIIEEELLKKSQTSHELQIKLRDYNEEVKKITEMQQKNKTLSSNISSYEKEVMSLKSEIKSLCAERNLANQKIHMQKAEVNDLNTMLKKTTTELQKKSTESEKYLSKVKALEAELLKCKQSMKGVTGSSEKMAANLKQEIHALQSDKKTADKKLDNLNVQLAELNSALKRAKDDLAKETEERKVKESKMMELEAELQKNKLMVNESLRSFEKSPSNLTQEITVLQRERAEAQEKSISLGSEVTILKEKLDQAQEEAKQKQKESSVLQLRSQQLEEQLENCKKMLEDLKGKLELQKKGYETQLLLVQTEIEQKLILQQSEIKHESEKKVKVPAEVEQMKSLQQSTLKLKQEADQQLQQMQIKMDKLQQERTMLSRDMSKAKSHIAQLEDAKIKLNSNISHLESLSNDRSKESAKLKQMLRESEQKLTIKEKEARFLNEQIASYVKEVKSLQEKLLQLEAVMKTESRKMNDLEVISETNQCVKDNEAAKLKTERIITQKIVPSYEGSFKHKLEDDVVKIKVSSEMASMEKENILEELKKVKQDKKDVSHSQSVHQDPATKNALNNSTPQTTTLHQKDIQNVTHTGQVKTNDSMTMTVHRYMSLCGLTERGPNETNTDMPTKVSHPANTLKGATTDCEGKQSVLHSTWASIKLPGLKGSTSIQKLIEIKLLDEEILKKLEMGLTTVEEVQASLAQFLSKPTTIAGVYVESSKKKISFLEAAEKGFLAKTYAIEFLEAQAATGSITDLATGKTYSVLDALERGILEADLKDKLMDAEKAVSGYIHGGKKLSVFQAVEERILDRYKGKKILEVQIATGGVINPDIGVRVPANIAFDQDLLNQATLKSLYDPISNHKSFHNPYTGQKSYYSEMLKSCLYDTDGGVYLFPIGDRHLSSISPRSSHRVSVVNSSRGVEMSAYEAYKGKRIHKRTYLFLSQQDSDWQEKSIVDVNGSPLHIIADLNSGRQLCLEAAVSQRFLETTELESYRKGLLSIYELADLIFSRMVVVEDVNSPIAGLWDVAQRKRLSVLQALQQSLIDRVTALRLLEAQACTGGICDPSSGEKATVTEALRRGLLDESFSHQLQQFEQAYHGIIQPKTAKTLSVAQAVQENLFPKDVGLRCLEFQLLTGGLINPETHDRVSLEEVIQSCLVDKGIAFVLKDEKSYTKSLTCPKTKRKISFKEALERSVYDCHTGLRLLEAAKAHSVGAKSTFQYIWAYNQL
ncbi:desmoplakin-like [Centroberyx affinis]|uniref:desmoplakin-like n=1 Tax=Centroberyx affinis TaxID=166261 RepID=UPI003A5C6F4F